MQILANGMAISCSLEMSSLVLTPLVILTQLLPGI